MGERLVRNRELELAPFDAVTISEWNDWEQNPFKNRTWQWRLNWLSFLPNLMAYHRSSGEPAALDTACEAIRSWTDAYLKTDTDHPFEFIWHDHATALRAEQLVFFAYYYIQSKKNSDLTDDGFLVHLKNALLVHAKILARENFYSAHTNHGLEQSRVLLLLGTVLEHDQALQWQGVAIRRIASELRFSFTTEGVHVENSPAYHIFVFKVFLSIINDYRNVISDDFIENFDSLSSKALIFITHILRPDGALPPIGDTEQLPTTDVYGGVFGDKLEYQHLLYALTQGRDGSVPSDVNQIYPRSGYAIFRDRWHSRKAYRQACHLIVKVGCSSRYHHQQDEGHISLYAGGEDWLIDSGLYNYDNTDAVRKYMRGRRGHNVPIVSHASYGKEFEHRLSAWKVTEYSTDELNPYLTMKLNILQPINHERRVDFDAAKKIVNVFDSISADDNKDRDIILQWHFPKNKLIQISGHKVIIASSKNNRMVIEFKGDVPDNLSVERGRKLDDIRSCISYKVNHLESSQVVRAAFRKRRELSVLTQFNLSIADPSESRRIQRAQQSLKADGTPRMQEDEVTYVTCNYQNADVILEYGSGGSTRVAAHMHGKLVMSVESDLDRARQLRRDLAGAASPVILQHVDIGEVAPSGRPLTDRSWRNSHGYANSVWDQPWFRQPDIVLINGRFRTACLASVILRTNRPVKVLFDDYGEHFQLIERAAKPVKTVGRMAEFLIKPGAYSQQEVGLLIEQFFLGEDP
ncbi:heparinase II/III family protein [Pelagerythrobacter sp.]|uniref:heparinase II/III family protein n=1 Tax=Pelagerythrobacter sp. TaxID=2800702 RepID=UPI0035AE3FB5